MSRLDQKRKKRLRRKFSIRKKIIGTPERPRLTIFKSNKYIYVQVIDDEAGNTLVSISNSQKDFSSIKSNATDAPKLGEAIGAKLAEIKVKSVVFDRNGYRYHGVVKAVADGVRKAGVEL